MKHLFLLFILLNLAGCQKAPQDTLEAEAIASLQSEVEQLKFENEQKDSLINDALRFYAEIEANLDNIDVRQRALKEKSADSELMNSDKSWVIQEIQQINFLREENKKKVSALQKQLKDSDLEVTELQNLIRSIMEDVQVKDEQLMELREELDRSNQELARLFDAYQEQEFRMQEVQSEMNKVYYVYGTEKELTENGVVDKKNGFLGIGKQIELKDKMNMSYLTEADLQELTKINIVGKKPRIITPHDSESYETSSSSNKMSLQIVNPRTFWKLSKVLIVVVD